MTTEQPFLQKADFGAIYDQPDPRRYFTALGEYDYVIPQTGADLFRSILAEVKERDPGRTPTTLDVCCSYGIVSVFMTTDLRIDDATARYLAPEIAAMTAHEVRAADRDLLREHRRSECARTLGLDVAANAVDYAVSVGALDEGFVENLELHPPSERLVEAMREVDLITITGGIGYVTEATFGRLLDVAKPSVQVAAFCLRTYDFGPISRALEAHGLVVETSAQTYHQRRFVDRDEQEWALAEVRRHGFDPTGKEDDGFYHATFHHARPAS